MVSVLVLFGAVVNAKKRLFFLAICTYANSMLFFVCSKVLNAVLFTQCEGSVRVGRTSRCVDGLSAARSDAEWNVCSCRIAESVPDEVNRDF